MEIGRLSAVFEADTRKFDAQLKASEERIKSLRANIASIKTDDIGFKSQRIEALKSKLSEALTSHKSLQSAQKATAKSAQEMSRDMQGALSTLSPQVAGLTSVVGPLSLIAGGMVAATAAFTGFFALLKHTADVAGGLKDLSDQTNFSVETLSTLDVAAKRSGSTLQGLSSSLIIFQKNQGAAAAGNKEMAAAFKSLGVDVHDHELGLRQAYTALAKLGTTQDATAKGAKLFGRGIKDVQGTIKETNGDIDAAMAKYSQWGGVISTETAVAADQFNDTLQTLMDQIDASARALLSTSLPVFTSFLEQISAALTGNAGSWQQWSGLIASEVAIALGSVRGFVMYLESLGTIPLNVAINMGIADTMSEAGKAIAVNKAMAATERASRLVGGGRGGGGGGGGGGRGGRGGTDPGLTLLQQLQKEFFNLTEHTKLEEIQERLLEKQFAKTTDQMKKRIMVQATEIDIMTEMKANWDSMVALVQKLGEQGEKGFVRARRAGQMLNEEFQKMIDLVREAGDQGVAFFTRQRTMSDLTGLLGTEGTRPRKWATGVTRERVATVDMQVMRERVAMMREQMNSLAYDLTDIFSRSIGEGFNQGIKSGLLTLGQGLLQIVEQVFLKRLAEGLSQMLGNLTTGGGGGGFWGGLFKAVLGGAVSGIGGSINLGGGSSYTPGGTGATRPRIVGRSSGGPLDPGNIYQVHKDEIIIPNSHGFVLPKGIGGETVVHNHFSINLPPAPKGSYVSPKSARQQADLVMAALRGAQ